MTVNIYLITLETRWIIYIFRTVGTQIKEEKDGQGKITKDREGQDLTGTPLELTRDSQGQTRDRQGQSSNNQGQVT